MPGRPKSKKINYPARADNIVPYNDLSILMKPEKLKEEMAELTGDRKTRLIALLASMYPRRVVVEMAGVTIGNIVYACKKHREIVESAQIGRNMNIVGLAERKVFDTLLRINPEKMHEDKKAQSARNLMEVAEMATAQIRPREKDDSMDTMSLIFQIKKHIKPVEKEVEANEPIEIEAKVLGDAK